MQEADRDPVIEKYKEGIDRTLIRANLKLTVTQRFEQLIAMAELHDEFRKAREEKARKAREKAGNAPPHS